MVRKLTSSAEARRLAPREPRKPESRRFLAFYDGDCRLCSSVAAQLDVEAVEMTPLQDAVALEAAGLRPEEAACALHVIAENGQIYRGVEALIKLLTTAYPRLTWLIRFYKLPGVSPLAEALYGWVAKHRRWLFGTVSRSQ